MKYRKKPTLTEATQWFKNGDHPQDQSKPVEKAGGSPGLTEGKVVRFFRSTNIPGGRFCPHCGNVMQRHGILDGLNGEETICPGDYIVTDSKGRFYRLPAAIFEAQYEPYEPAAHPTPMLSNEA
jgi:hypothetical protein